MIPDQVERMNHDSHKETKALTQNLQPPSLDTASLE
jgi:hypothetical protein